MRFELFIPEMTTCSLWLKRGYPDRHTFVFSTPLDLWFHSYPALFFAFVHPLRSKSLL